jgi:hypothetical protein
MRTNQAQRTRTSVIRLGDARRETKGPIGDVAPDTEGGQYKLPGMLTAD